MRDMETYIIIDDDSFSNTICRLIIKNYLNPSGIHVFTSPHDGLQFLTDRFSGASKNEPACLLLDINMPGMSGWELIEEFEKQNLHLNCPFKIYILSSSVSEYDIAKSGNNKLITDYIIKPLTKEKILALLPEN